MGEADAIPTTAIPTATIPTTALDPHLRAKSPPPPIPPIEREGISREQG